MRLIAYVALAAMALPLCAVALAEPAGGSAHLDVSELVSGRPPDRVVDNRAFAPDSAASSALVPFDGELITTEVLMRTMPDDIGAHAVLGKDAQYFPALRISFITVDGDLVPTTEGVVRVGSKSSGRAYWDVIVQPGRIWSEPADNGWSRASFPFALVHTLEGESHNGLATFAYKDGQVSALRYQIVTQTTPGNVETMFSAFGSVPARAHIGRPRDAASVARGYRAAKADEIRIRPWSELELLVGHSAVSGFADALPPSQTVLTGLDYRGTFYLKGCESQGGPLPWCDRARFGVWSVTKAFANEVALLRLAQKYGPEVFNARIVDYVPAAKAYPAWSNVTFDDCINMATGIGNGSTKRDPNEIEDGYLDSTYNDWYWAASRDDKVSALLRIGRVYPWGHGRVARYRDQDMFILGVAMDAYLKTREGPGASLWGMLEHEVYQPIGIHYAPTGRTIESAGEGHPTMAFGVFATIGDLVKIARLYHGHGRWRGTQILYAPRVEELLAGTQPRGLPTGAHDEFGETTYFNAFWQIRFDANDACKLYIPQMVGWGGNIVALYPGGLTGVRIAHVPVGAAGAPDDPVPMARVANRLAPFCH